jgi:hypothetical protein
LKTPLDIIRELWHYITIKFKTYKEKRQMNTKIETAIENILKTGTKIVSFNYHGKPRNVLVGSNQALREPVWGRMLNRAIRSHLGVRYLVGLDNNDSRQFKTFKLSEIEAPSFVK